MKWKWRRYYKTFPGHWNAQSPEGISLHLEHHALGWDAIVQSFKGFERIKVRNIATRRLAIRMAEAALAVAMEAS